MRIKVGPHAIKLRIKTDAEMEEDWGRFFEGALEIWINEDQSPSSGREATLHETLHAVFNVTGLDKLLEDTPLEEEIVRRMSPILLATLRDNPQLIRILLSEEN